MASKSTFDAINNAYALLQENKRKKIFRDLGSANNLDDLEVTISEIDERIEAGYDYVSSLHDLVAKDYLKSLDAYRASLHLIEHYSDSQYINNLQRSRNEIKRVLDNSVEWYPMVLLYKKYNELESTPSDSKQYEETLKHLLSEFHDTIKSTNKQKKILDKNLKLIEERYKDVVAKSEIDIQKNQFEIAADKHRQRAIITIVITFIYLAIISPFLWYIMTEFCFEVKCFDRVECLEYDQICPDCGKHMLYFEMFKAAFFRLLTISLILYILSFLIKNYNASMHNMVINKQRANSLDASQGMLDSLSQEARDKVLLQVSNSIFSHQKTGYLRKEGDPQNPNFIEKIIDKTPGL